MSPARGKLALLALLMLPSCGSGSAGASASGDVPAPSAVASTSVASTSAASTSAAASAGCGEREGRLRQQPALPGSPSFEANRVELTGRPRGTPLLWKRVPEGAAHPSAAAAS